jgi:hypothetical protein
LLAVTGCADEKRQDPFAAPGLGTTAGSSDGGDTEGMDGDGDTEGASSGTDGSPDGDPGTGGTPGTLASGISVSKVEANQGVAVGLADAGSPVAVGSRNAELIRGRTTLVRAAWQVENDWSPRTIEARLIVTYSDGTTEELTDEKMVSGAADPMAMDGAFTWELAAEAVEAGMTYQVQLLEADGMGRGDSSDGAIFPGDGPTDLGITPDPMNMKLVLIPVNTPQKSVDLDESMVAMYRDRMFATYPLQDIEVVVRTPWVVSSQVSNLDDAFNYMTQARAQDGEPPQTYYHLIMDMNTCCSGTDMEGWAGIANLVDPAGTVPREGISKIDLSYPEGWDWDVDTVVHEVGHNHGRNHAPCGDPAGADTAYPYPGAAVTTAGYDIDNQVLIDPTEVDEYTQQATTDFMSYCSPQWWSDYSWQALIERVRISSMAARAKAPRWDHVALRGVVREDGSVTWSKVPALATPVGVRAGDVTLRSAAGATVGYADVFSYEIADTNVTVIQADVTSMPSFETLALDLDMGIHVEAKASDFSSSISL